MWSHVQNFESSEGLVAEIIPALFMHSFFSEKDPENARFS